MSGPGPSGNPFEGVPFFGDLLKMLQQAGGQTGLGWDVARQMAIAVATDGENEPNVDPIERMRFDELVRVADLHVADATGLATSLTGRTLGVVPVTRADWAVRSLDANRPLLERLATSLSRMSDDPSGSVETPDPDDPMAGMLSGLTQMLGPMMLGMTAGSMVGHLARVSLGQYDLPVPRPPSDELLVVPANLAELAAEWSLPDDELRLWVCLHEVTNHAVLGRRHVRERLETLMGAYVDGFRLDPTALESAFGDVDPTDPTGLQSLVERPEALLGAMRTDEQAALATRLEAVTSAVVGYVDHVMDAIGGKLIPSYGMTTEAQRRRRVAAGESARFVERLLGLDLGQRQYDRGAAFIEGVVERAGDDGLRRLWASDATLPTPAEIDAPGLWLARIEIDEG
jgi:putative hydrolase